LGNITFKRILLDLVRVHTLQRVLSGLALKILLVLPEVLHEMNFVAGFRVRSGERGGLRDTCRGKLHIALREKEGEDHKETDRFYQPRFSLSVIRDQHNSASFLKIFSEQTRKSAKE